MRTNWILAAVLFLSVPLFGAGDKPEDLPQRAIARSQLTLPGSKPFHIKVSVVEGTNRDNDSYKAEIEEYWTSADDWWRTVKSAEYSETVVVKGGERHETSVGDYSPHWLRTIVAALFDPGSPLSGIQLANSNDNPVLGGSLLCRRFEERAGIAPVSNRVFSSYCFRDGLIASIGTPGYRAEYLDYRRFGEKQVARKIREWIEPGTEVEASITTLETLTVADAAFSEMQPSAGGIRTVILNEDALRQLAQNVPPMQWPTIRGGKSSGVLSIYVCIDRSGRAREIYGLNSDHPDMTDAAQKQVMAWKFHPAVVAGEAVQVEGILTFAYATRIEK